MFELRSELKILDREFFQRSTGFLELRGTEFQWFEFWWLCDDQRYWLKKQKALSQQPSKERMIHVFVDGR